MKTFKDTQNIHKSAKFSRISGRNLSSALNGFNVKGDAACCTFLLPKWLLPSQSWIKITKDV